MVCAVALYGMVWPLILIEWSVMEDSSFGGAASAGFSADFTSFYCGFSCAGKPRGRAVAEIATAKSRLVHREQFILHLLIQAEIFEARQNSEL